MFLNEFYVVIICLVACVISQYTGQTAKNIKQRNLEEKKGNDPKIKKILIKNDKMSARQNLIKQKDKKEQNSTRWPNVLRHRKPKGSARITKMAMLQNQDDPDPTEEPTAFNDDNTDNSYYFSSYSLKQQLIKMANEIPNVNITIEIIGRTLEYQDIVMLRIAQNIDKYFRSGDNKYAEELPEKKIIFIVHGLSVMGMTTISCLSYMRDFRTLLSFYMSHLEKFNIFLIPMANPDGFSYLKSEKSELWNKNVAPQGECVGVTLDRNFDVAWKVNRSISSCSQEYPGQEPFSEAETRAVRDIFHKYAHKIVAYFNVHAASYSSSVFRGDAVLYPKGYNDTALDEDKYIDLKGEIDEAMRNASFSVYSFTVDTLYNWYGPVTGTSVDFASTVYGIPFAMELVMQKYNDDEDDSSDENFSSIALNDVWGKVIDVMITYIWKSSRTDGI